MDNLSVLCTSRTDRPIEARHARWPMESFWIPTSIQAPKALGPWSVNPRSAYVKDMIDNHFDTRCRIVPRPRAQPQIPKVSLTRISQGL